VVAHASNSVVRGSRLQVSELAVDVERDRDGVRIAGRRASPRFCTRLFAEEVRDEQAGGSRPADPIMRFFAMGRRLSSQAGAGRKSHQTPHGPSARAARGPEGKTRGARAIRRFSQASKAGGKGPAKRCDLQHLCVCIAANLGDYWMMKSTV